MFQSTQRTNSLQGSQDQREEAQKRDQQAQAAVEEAQRRMMSDAQLRSLELQRQTIEGEVEHVRAKQREGASAQQVAERDKENTVGDLDFELGRLSPPRFNEDKRGEIRLAFMRAVDTQAREIEAKHEAQESLRVAEERSRDERASKEPNLTLAA